VSVEERHQVEQQQPALRLIALVALADAELLVRGRGLVAGIEGDIGRCLYRRLDERLPWLGEVDLELGGARKLRVARRDGHGTRKRLGLAFDQAARGAGDCCAQILLAAADRDEAAPHRALQAMTVLMREREGGQALLAGDEHALVTFRNTLPARAGRVLDEAVFIERAAGLRVLGRRHQAAQHKADLFVAAGELSVGQAGDRAGERGRGDVETLMGRLIEFQAGRIGWPCRDGLWCAAETGLEARQLERRGERHALDQILGPVVELGRAPGFVARDMLGQRARIGLEQTEQLFHELVIGKAQDRRRAAGRGGAAPHRPRCGPGERMGERGHQIFPAPGV
jgi:hypothetical protein